MDNSAYNARVTHLREETFNYWHARLFALQEFGIISENCPERNYWSYRVHKPDELPDEIKAIHKVYDRTNPWEDYGWEQHLKHVDSDTRDAIAYVEDTIYYP